MPACLVVDDSRVIRKLARSILEQLGFVVLEADDGAQALECCRGDMPDLIVLDWYMPVMDGLTFLKTLRALSDGKKPRVIFCTTENDITHIREALAAGADEYVMKPFDADILESKLRYLQLI